jgi:hypothetical protein
VVAISTSTPPKVIFLVALTVVAVGFVECEVVETKNPLLKWELFDSPEEISISSSSCIDPSLESVAY